MKWCLLFRIILILGSLLQIQRNWSKISVWTTSSLNSWPGLIPSECIWRGKSSYDYRGFESLICCRCMHEIWLWYKGASHLSGLQVPHLKRETGVDWAWFGNPCPYLTSSISVFWAKSCIWQGIILLKLVIIVC